MDAKRPPWSVNWWFGHAHQSPHQGGHRGPVYRTAPARPIRLRSATNSRGNEGLPFLAILSRSVVEAACRAFGHHWRERVYPPWITLSLFLSQVLSDDHSCDEAVDRFQKFRYDQGLPAGLPRDDQLLRGPPPPARGARLGPGPPHRAVDPRAGRGRPGCSTAGRSRSSTAPP